jgi:hypothetical protein
MKVVAAKIEGKWLWNVLRDESGSYGWEAYEVLEDHSMKWAASADGLDGEAEARRSLEKWLGETDEKSE